MVAQTRHLINLYEEMKVPKEKLIFQFPGTWEGIQASRQIESEGVATLVFLVFRHEHIHLCTQPAIPKKTFHMTCGLILYSAHIAISHCQSVIETSRVLGLFIVKSSWFIWYHPLPGVGISVHAWTGPCSVVQLS